MGVPKLYRKRYMPNEIVHLKDDIITYQAENVMVTKWDVLHPKAKFSHGVSCYYMDKGWIPIYAMENVLSMFHSYENLDGNGTVPELVHELKELRHSDPSKREEE